MLAQLQSCVRERGRSGGAETVRAGLGQVVRRPLPLRVCTARPVFLPPTLSWPLRRRPPRGWILRLALAPCVQLQTRSSQTRMYHYLLVQ